MRRRTFLQTLLSAPALALLRPQSQEARVGYTDSDSNSAQILAALHDGKTRAGGVAYQG